MKKKLQVFISSTYTDLIEERQAAVQAVLDSGHIPAGMELFKAGNISQLETIYKWIDASDIYMPILGGRYGSIEELSGKSYTQLEYEYAVEKKIPIFSVVLKEKFLCDKASKHGKDNIFEVNNPQKFSDFKSYVMSKIIREVEDSKDIKLSVHTTLNDFMDEYDLIGWVRGNDTTLNAPLLQQINDLHIQNQRLTSESEELKNQMADYKNSFESNLAFENDKIILSGSFEKYLNKQSYTHTFEKVITWNEMFLLWAPYLFETLNVGKAQDALEKAVSDFIGIAYPKINKNLFQTIKVQYIALGLIKSFEAKTTAGGIAEFITLTNKGKNYLIQNKAIKK